MGKEEVLGLREAVRSAYKEQASLLRLGKVFALSVVLGYQTGKVYTLGNLVLIYHSCGFAFVCGEASEAELNALYREAADLYRFTWFCEDDRAAAYLEKLPGVMIRKRLFFEYPAEEAEQLVIPEGFELKEIDEELAMRLKGRITLSFSWDNYEQYAKHGKGFCLTDNGNPVAWAFSAAVSDEEIDIGVECLEEYRHRGLSAIVVREMIRYALEAGKKPTWACIDTNEFSRKLAEKCGFVKSGECRIVMIMPRP